MQDVGSLDPLHAARHEAGHAVIAYLKGYTPKAIRVWEKDGHWLGECSLGSAPIRVKASFSFGLAGNENETRELDNHISISVAGALAQCRTVAEETFEGPAKFDASQDLANLLHILLNEQRSGSGVKAGVCQLHFSTSLGKQERVMEGAWVSGLDIYGVRQAASAALFTQAAVTERAVRSVMETLNDDKNWNAILTVAAHLLARPLGGDLPARMLEGEALLNAIGEPNGRNSIN